MEMLEKVATPLVALTGFAPEIAPPPGFAPIPSVMDAEELVTVLPSASCTVTTMAGLMLEPAVALVGCTVNATLVAAPAPMLNALLVAPVRPPELAVSV